MDMTPIKTKRDYRRALKEIEAVMDAKRRTPEGDRLDVLVTLVEAWEAKQRIRLLRWASGCFTCPLAGEVEKARACERFRG